jgi:aminoglycoside phosphotransferase (APT) family kinase protein
VLDWELSTIGHPIADLGYNCLMYRSDSIAFGSLVGTDFAASGIPTEAEYIAAYCRRAGRDAIADLDFYLAFALFRLASIAQGREKRRRDGVTHREPPPGNSCRDQARRGWAIIERG